MKGRLVVLIVGGALLVGLPQAHGDYMLAPSPAFVDAPAETEFSVDLDLVSDGSDAVDSVIFDLRFSDPGVVLKGYTWGGVFSGSEFDASAPLSGSLGAGEAVGTDTYVDAAGLELVDIHLENFTVFGDFTDGTLITLDFAIPAGFDFGPDGKVVVEIVPDTLADGGQEVTTTGGSFEILPEPASLSLLAFGAIGLLRRRRA